MPCAVCGDGRAFMHSCAHDLSECTLINKWRRFLLSEAERLICSVSRLRSRPISCKRIPYITLFLDAQRMGRQGWGRLFLIKIKYFILCYGLFLHTHTPRGSVLRRYIPLCHAHKLLKSFSSFSTHLSAS